MIGELATRLSQLLQVFNGADDGQTVLDRIAVMVGSELEELCGHGLAMRKQVRTHCALIPDSNETKRVEAMQQNHVLGVPWTSSGCACQVLDGGP